MAGARKVLLVGGTGRTGRRVLEQLLDRGIEVRAIVRSLRRLPAVAEHAPGLAVVEADLHSLSDDDLLGHVRDCDVIISCLGHVTDLKGIFGPPRDLVTRAVTRLCRAVQAAEPAIPVKLILMSSVSVNRAGGLDSRRGRLERLVLWILRLVVPPAKDNQRAADFLHGGVGAGDPYVRWVAVRPDSLMEGDVSDYTVHEGLVSSLFTPDSANMANVAHFMCELAADPEVWGRWEGKLPVIVNASAHKG